MAEPQSNKIMEEFWEMPVLEILISLPPELFSSFLTAYFNMVFELKARTKSFSLGFVIGSMGYSAYFMYLCSGVNVPAPLPSIFKALAGQL